MEVLKKEIEELLAKHLPAQANEWLKNRLIEADTMERTITDLRKVNGDHQSLIFTLQEKVRNYQSLEHTAETLARREADVKDKESKLAIDVAVYKMEQAIIRAIDMKEMVALVFKSPVYREAYVHNLYSGVDERGNYQTKGTYPAETIKSTE